VVEAWCAQANRNAAGAGRVRVLAVLFEASRQQDSQALLARLGERLRRGRGVCNCATSDGDSLSRAKRQRLAGDGEGREESRRPGGVCSCDQDAADDQHHVMVDLSTSVQSLSRRFELCVWIRADGRGDGETALRLTELHRQWQLVRPSSDFMTKNAGKGKKDKERR
jgi:hypothetical protein